MVDDIAFTGENLKKGLEKEGHDVFLTRNLKWHHILSKKLAGRQGFDIVHIHSPNFKKLGISWRYLTKSLLSFDIKLVCHWHGSDLRHPTTAFPVYEFLKRAADFNLYSTLDLAWWLRKIPRDKKMLLTCPIDTDLFKSNGNTKQGAVVFTGGGKSMKVHKVPHDMMPEYLNRFETVHVYNADGLDDGLLSVVAMEAVACGCVVPELPWLDRRWVLDNASIALQTEKLINVYEGLMK